MSDSLSAEFPSSPDLDEIRERFTAAFVKGRFFPEGHECSPYVRLANDVQPLLREVERLQALIAEREEIGTLEHAKQHISCGVVIASKDAEVERLRDENEQLRVTLMRVEEMASRSQMADSAFRAGAWAEAVAALDRAKAS